MRLGDCKLAVMASVLSPAQFLQSEAVAAAASRSATQAVAVSADYKRL